MTTKTELPEDISKLSFEAALEELKTLVGQLESGEGSLDDAIAAYERGTQLKRHCEAKLKEAKAKIEKIQMDADGNLSTEPFDT